MLSTIADRFGCIKKFVILNRINFILLMILQPKTSLDENKLTTWIAERENRLLKKSIGSPIDEFRPSINENGAAIDEIRQSINENCVAIDEIRPSIKEFGAAINEFMSSINENGAAINEFRQSINEKGAAIDEFRLSINDFDSPIDESGFSLAPINRRRVPNGEQRCWTQQKSCPAIL
jgi:methyl-accepting chemotaxis protein